MRGATLPVATASSFYAPQDVVVPRALSVEWTMDLAAHTITTAASRADALASVPDDPFGEDDDPDTFSVFLAQGDSFEHRFSQPGEHAYFCFFHAAQGMVGTVTVVG